MQRDKRFKDDKQRQQLQIEKKEKWGIIIFFPKSKILMNKGTFLGSLLVLNRLQ